MAAKTIRERLIAACEARGYVRESVRTTKYVVFRRPTDAMTRSPFVYIGKLGALRVGYTAGDSVAASLLKTKMLTEA